MSLSVVNDSLSVSDVNSFLTSSVVNLDRIDPVNKTSNFTVDNQSDVYIVAGSANVTVTLPAASSNIGRVLHFKNQTAYTLVSANSDVCPRNSLTPGTAILAATIGHSATLISNGVNWFNIRHANF